MTFLWFLSRTYTRDDKFLKRQITDNVINKLLSSLSLSLFLKNKIGDRVTLFSLIVVINYFFSFRSFLGISYYSCLIIGHKNPQS